MSFELPLAVVLVAAVVIAAAAGLCLHALRVAITAPRVLMRAIGAAWEVARS